MSALDTSLSGLHDASTRFADAAGRIVQSGTQGAEALSRDERGRDVEPVEAAVSVRGADPLSGDTAAALVELVQSEQAFKVNAAVAGKVSDLYKETLNILGPRDQV
ncbi:hypothetical protein HPQ64_15400 [Rhizobiales bacterium]|uniref:hypothetical protein n=1 Tax=Hongsoonwoonella zoysiae TaxID=2821844 RepID=UPI00156002A1|nr:hypothetical protein [Hongsoonwoonella zoysiae]NRG19076.1 hypothetical protein [Hongsoonwoonella zoysiae]